MSAILPYREIRTTIEARLNACRALEQCCAIHSGEMIVQSPSRSLVSIRVENRLFIVFIYWTNFSNTFAILKDLWIWTQPALQSYLSWAADWRALQETYVKRCIFSSGSPWRYSNTIRWLSRVLFWSPPNWTSATPANFVLILDFNSRYL